MVDLFRQVFQNETEDLLTELESALLALSETPDDTDLVDRIFRAMHTIKGSGAMCGFNDVVAFTHDLETVLDDVRDGRVPVTPELVQLNLKACDQIRRMVNLKGADPDAVADVQRMLGTYVDTHGPAEGKPEIGELSLIRIAFQPDPDIFESGSNPIFLLDQLREMGDCRLILRSGQLPRLESLDPDVCYFRWDIELKTRESLQAVKDVFLFVEDRCSLDFEVTAVGEDSAEAPSRRERPKTEAAMPAEMRGLGIRVAAKKLDLLMDLVGELVGLQSALSRQALNLNNMDLISMAEAVERLTADLRATSMSIRMLPISTLFVRFRRLVYDLCQELGKQVDFETSGGDTELDKTILEQLTDPLIHLVRNAVDHGIESPIERAELRKPIRGTLRISAEHAAGNVVIRIADDGAGFDRTAILRRGVELGIFDPDDPPDEDALLSLIFMPGFSTRHAVSAVSGRGVGLDVVKNSIENLRGTITVNSREREGSEMVLRLPMTLAIIEGLLVRVSKEHYVIPMAVVEACVERDRSEYSRSVIRFRDRWVPLVWLRQLFDTNGARPRIEHVVIVWHEDDWVGIVADEIIGGHQTVIKPLGRLYRRAGTFSGFTLMGDGSVAMVLDLMGMVAVYQSEISASEGGETP